jgi:sugar lactone lactonase YvrE
MRARTYLSFVIAAAMLSACTMGNETAVPASQAVDTAYGHGRVAYKIYVANVDTITTYEPDGTQTTPTITTALYLFGIAIAPNGTIYALTFNPLSGPNTPGTITSYTPDGKQIKPTITIKERGYQSPSGIAVDSSGKIYVLSSAHNGSRGIVTAYEPDGDQTTPTFRTGPDSESITIDANDKIYVANDTGPPGASSITTYLSDGTPTKPTITRDVHQPDAVAVAADGTIYVANSNNRGPDGTEAGEIKSYGASGNGPLLSIRDREAPGGVAETNGLIYIASSSAYSSVLKTYTIDGHRIAPTITAGLDEPSTLAIH